jgi:hypothetical protein
MKAIFRGRTMSDLEREIMYLVDRLEKEQTKTDDLLNQWISVGGKNNLNDNYYGELERKYRILKKKLILTNLELLNLKSK